MSGTRLHSSTEGNCLLLTIDSADHRHALTPEVCAAGIEALNVAESNPEVRCVVITGAAPAFSAGEQLPGLLASRQGPTEAGAVGVDALHSWIETIRAFPKPVIAAVSGVCSGAGLSLALACDFVVAARDSAFSLSQSAHGLSPTGGLTWAFARSLPRATVMQWLMAGDKISATRLLELGVVNALCEPGQVLSQSLSIAERLQRRAGHALASIKELVNDAQETSLHQQLAAERSHFVRNLHHPETGARLAALSQPPLQASR
ncbi:enoyl-CoA hydratase-related protein [Hydrogenophaga sp.]|uniref:enoyl-CoA hydratase-related protein n=1 Tax=Hydrogenophaga sp. TaxID=1904254 RepID=UPI00391DF06E